jgi:hypothetical protein
MGDEVYNQSAGSVSRICKKTKTINITDSLVVTHPTTNVTAHCLSTAERTGSPVFSVLWSIAKTVDLPLDIIRSFSDMLDEDFTKFLLNQSKASLQDHVHRAARQRKEVKSAPSLLSSSSPPSRFHITTREPGKLRVRYECASYD